MASTTMTSRILGRSIHTRRSLDKLSSAHASIAQPSNARAISSLGACLPPRKLVRHGMQSAKLIGWQSSAFHPQCRRTGAMASRSGSRVICSASPEKHRVVFMGTPDIAANVLQALMQEAAKPESTFEVSAVVTQPGRPTGRKRVIKPSPVEALARDAGVPEDSILTPVSARDEEFLDQMRAIRPCLCVTAAYGNFLPQKFLDIPTFGTLNIHPSLLPAFRGAAPVQRALESGVSKSGVTVAFTVLKMDAGPVLTQEVVDVDPNIKTPEMLEQMFDKGAKLLIHRLESVWSGEAAEIATPQDPNAVIHTDKLTKDEALLDFALPAEVLHNKVRGFAGWPGTEADFTTSDPNGKTEGIRLKIITTRVGSESGPDDPSEVEFRGDAMVIQCGEGSVLEVLEVQPPAKKVMGAKAFQNGLKNGKKRLFKHQVAEVAAEE